MLNFNPTELNYDTAAAEESTVKMNYCLRNSYNCWTFKECDLTWTLSTFCRHSTCSVVDNGWTERREHIGIFHRLSYCCSIMMTTMVDGEGRHVDDRESEYEKRTGKNIKTISSLCDYHDTLWVHKFECHIAGKFSAISACFGASPLFAVVNLSCLVGVGKKILIKFLWFQIAHNTQHIFIRVCEWRINHKINSVKSRQIKCHSQAKWTQNHQSRRRYQCRHRGRCWNLFYQRQRWNEDFYI